MIVGGSHKNSIGPEGNENPMRMVHFYLNFTFLPMHLPIFMAFQFSILIRSVVLGHNSENPKSQIIFGIFLNRICVWQVRFGQIRNSLFCQLIN